MNIVVVTVDSGFEPLSHQPKDYVIGICFISAKHTAFRRKSKDWLARRQDNVSECSDGSKHRRKSKDWLSRRQDNVSECNN